MHSDQMRKYGISECNLCSLVPRPSASSALLTFKLARNQRLGPHKYFPASEFKGQALVRKGGEPENEARIHDTNPILRHSWS